MYDKQLQKIRKDTEGDGDQMQPPCPVEAIDDLRRRTREELRAEIPDAYAAFLSKTNGLDYNGLVIYANERGRIAGYEDRTLEGLVDGNLIHREFEALCDYLVFGNSGGLLYALKLSSSEYLAIDSISLDPDEKFDSFDAMLADAFRRHLQN